MPGESILELTYVTSCDGKNDCLMAVEIGCLESDQPCVGKPKLLFKLSITDDRPRPPMLFPNWSTDGQQLVFQAIGATRRSDIFVGNIKDKIWINLTNTPNIIGNPNWSPDNQRIIYTEKTEDPENILRAYSISRDGNDIQRLLGESSEEFNDIRELSWPSDFSRIAFLHSDVHGFSQIFVSDSADNNHIQLTYDEIDHLNPRFSPDGQYIVFTKETSWGSLTNNLFMIRADGSNEEAITQGENVFYYQPVWSPDSNWIAFGINKDGVGNIYLIKKDGKALTQITEGNKGANSPAWRVISR